MQKKLKRILSKSPSETWDAAALFAKELPAGSVIALHGQLGAGKTCFIQGMALALGVNEPISSPTYTLIDEYQGKQKLVHMDLYRLSSSVEAIGIGLEEYLTRDNIIAIEWAERAQELLPDNLIHVDIKVGSDPNTRIINIFETEK
tara:strand:+ start:160 stop:597 length:438 start_codon:yes stop_codon:yes gene_type:complete